MTKYKDFPIKGIPGVGDILLGTDSESSEVESSKNFDLATLLSMDLTIFYNNTGALITKCTPLSRGMTTVDDIAVAKVSTNDSEFDALSYIGLAVTDVPDGEVGYAMRRGTLKGCNTTGMGPLLYLGVNGAFVYEKPIYPANRLYIGAVTKSGTTDGEITLDNYIASRNDLSKSYHFTSTGVGSGLFDIAGFYDFDSSDVTLNQGALTVDYGNANNNRIKGAHAGIVPSGPGTVDTGQVGLRVSGIIDDEANGGQSVGTDIITEDITTLVLDEYFETPAKFSGEITFELYVVSGTPTTYSLTFNYGFAKYDDFQDRDATIYGFEAVFRGDNNNNTLDLGLRHHKRTGWTYAATGFEPGNGYVCRLSDDRPLTNVTDNNMYGAYKRNHLDTFIAGESDEGFIVEVITSGNSTLQGCSLHVKAVSEELNR